MPRYLSFHVGGDAPHVSDRIHRAFQRIGKVQEFNSDTSNIAGVIRVDGEPAQVKVAWKIDAKDEGNRYLLDIEADSSDRLSEAADRAMYALARAYKENNPDTIPNRKGAFLLVLLLVTLVLAGYFFLRH
jgi:hypothetical protein